MPRASLWKLAPWLLAPWVLTAPLTLLAESGQPAPFTATLDLSAAGSVALTGSGLTETSGASRDLSVSALWRASLGPAGWYFEAGPDLENTSFGSGSPLLPRQLQVVAVDVAVGYYQDGEEAAALKFSPGWYFQNRPSADAMDIPVEIYSGIPIESNLNGVLGAANARFYHHPFPIAGIVWNPTKNWQVQAVFPDPSITRTLPGGWTAAIAGELGGGGYRTASDTVIEYSTYRVGPTLGWKNKTVELKLSCGDEVQREFDFFHHGPALQGGCTLYGELSLTVAAP